jgi:hypothetical protein
MTPEEENAQLRARAERAESDAAALRQALEVIVHGIKDHARRDIGDYLLITPTAAVFARATLKVRPSGTRLLAIYREVEELRIAMRDVEMAQTNTEARQATLRTDRYWRALRSLLENAAIEGLWSSD